jgi:hypothetical protein
MFKNAAIGVLAATTALCGFLAYQSGQKAVALEVLLDDKSKTITTLETENKQLTGVSAQLQAAIDGYTKAEDERKAAEAQLNAAVVNEADTKEFGEPCRVWIAKQFGDKDSPTFTKSLTTISDSWLKDGKLVFEIATPTSISRSSNSMFLCIVDKAKGSMFKPSAFETANWRRSK